MTAKKEPRQIYETTIRLDMEMANRMGIVSQVLGKSRNALMTQAITESILTYEGNPEYQKQRKEWIAKLAKVGT